MLDSGEVAFLCPNVQYQITGHSYRHPGQHQRASSALGRSTRRVCRGCRVTVQKDPALPPALPPAFSWTRLWEDDQGSVSELHTPRPALSPAPSATPFVMCLQRCESEHNPLKASGLCQRGRGWQESMKKERLHLPAGTGQGCTPL